MGAADEPQSRQTGGAEQVMGRLYSCGAEGVKAGLSAEHYSMSGGDVKCYEKDNIHLLDLSQYIVTI